ncbi:MAG: DUF3168 domain-containing protein [Marinibacterium sp.]
MSYGVAAALQKAVFTALSADPALTALVGSQIFETVPSGPVPDIYVALGPEEVRDRSDQTGPAAEHRFTVSVVAQAHGFAAAKAAAGAVNDALAAPLPVLDRGRLIGLWFDRASARRTGTSGRIRRIDLRFRARVEDT